MAKIISPDRLSGGQEVAENSLVAVTGLPINVESGIVSKADAGEKIEGLSMETKTFDSDNESVKKSKLEFVRLKDETEVEFEVSGGTISTANVGDLFDITSTGVVNGASITPVAQVDTVTLTGTSGTATVTGAGALTKTVTFDTDLTTTAAAFVTANDDAYAAQGITLTSSGADLIFTSTLAGNTFVSPSITNATGNQAGTVANTTANISAPSQLRLRKVLSTTKGVFVRAK